MFDYQYVKEDSNTYKKIDKDYILSTYSQSDIYQNYLGFSPDLSKSFYSPFNEEKTPSFRFYVRNGKIMFKDFSSGNGGDVFDLITYLFGLGSLYEICQQIEEDMGSGDNNVVRVSLNDEKIIIKNSVSDKVIDIVIRDFNKTDFEYWKQYGIDLSLLNKYNIKACDKVWLGDNLWYNDTLNNPCYRYRFRGKVKCYKPLSIDKKKKFLSNCNNRDNIQGMEQIDSISSDIGIITSSYKDVIVVNEYWKIPSIAPHGESHILDSDVISWFKSKFKKTYIFYNNDNQGIESAEKHKELYGMETIVCDSYKDPSDYIKNLGIEEFVKLKERLIYG